MNTPDNKRRMQAIFAALEQGDGQPFVDAMRDDMSWQITGTGPWSKTWRGKKAVRGDLFKPLFAQFEGTYRNTASRFVAEDDIVVVECRGNVATKAGARYDNSYCYICRFADDGMLVEIVEYLDTALVERVLAPPPA